MADKKIYRYENTTANIAGYRNQMQPWDTTKTAMHYISAAGVHYDMLTLDSNLDPTQNMRNVYVTGELGIGITNAIVALHVRSADSGGAPNAGSLMCLESDADSAQNIEFINQNTGAASIVWSDVDSYGMGIIKYDNNGDYMEFTVNTAAAVRITSAGYVKIGTTGVAADSMLHVMVSEVVSGSSSVNAVMTLEKNDNCILQFITPNNKVAEIAFGDVTNAQAGRIVYTHGTGMGFFTETTLIYSIDGDGIKPSSPATIHCYAAIGAPGSTTAGAFWLDTDAGANGTLMCYTNGAWRTVVAF